MIALGVLFGTVGQDIYTGTPRFVFDQRELYGGIDFVSVAVGILASLIIGIPALRVRGLFLAVITVLVFVSAIGRYVLAAPIPDAFDIARLMLECGARETLESRT